jgi:hypothetical protein
MSTYFSLSGFEPATDTQIKAIDAAKSPAPAPGEMSYDVKKSLDMGWQIATGADKQTFNATYETLPADVAKRLADEAEARRRAAPAPRPAPSSLTPKIFAAVGIAGGVIALTLAMRAWWPTTAH